MVLSINNPFLTPDQRALIQDAIDNGFSDQNVFGNEQDYFYLSRANTDFASNRATSTDDIYRVVLGLDGKFDLLAGRWKWEIVGNRGVAKSKGMRPPSIRRISTTRWMRCSTATATSSAVRAM